MAEQDPKEPKKGTEEPKSGQAPTEVEVPDVHGKKSRMPLEKALALAGKAMEVENAEQALRKERAALAKDTEAFKQYQEFRQHLAVNRDAAKAVALALDDPRKVLELAATGQRPAKAPKAKDDDEGGDEGGDPSPAHAPQDDALRKELDAVKAKLEEREAKETAETLKAKIKAEIGDYPWLKGKRSELAFRQAVSHLRDDPSAPITRVVATIATEIKEAMEGDQSDALAESQRGQAFRTDKPGRGRPAFSPPEKITGADLKNGKLHQYAIQIAKNWGLPV